MCSCWTAPTLLAILSQPPGTINGVLRVTIQVGQPWGLPSSRLQAPCRHGFFLLLLHLVLGGSCPPGHGIQVSRPPDSIPAAACNLLTCRVSSLPCVA